MLPNDRARRGDVRPRAREGRSLSVRLTDLAVGPARRHRRQAGDLHTASIGVFVGAGSRHEREGEHGLSHLLEHMAFKGTRRRNARADRRDDRERRRRPQRRDQRRADRLFRPRARRGRRLALDMLADILTDSQFDPDELEREKNVILQEIGAVEDTPDDLVFDLFTAAAWPGQPIGRPILGTRESVGGFDRAAIPPISRRNYRAGATMVAGAGAVDHDGSSRAPKRCWRRRRRQGRAAGAGALSRRRDAGQEAARADPYRRRLRGPRRSPPPSTTPRMCSPPRPAAACRRGCSRRCARSAASPIRSTPSTGALPRLRPVRLLRRLGEAKDAGEVIARRARLPRRGDREA